MSTKIVIIGGKGTAVVVAEEIIDAIERYGYQGEILGFAFDDPEMDHVLDYPILCHSYEAKEKFATYEDVKFLYLMYRSDLIKVRSELRDSFNIPKNKYLNFIHPNATVVKSVKMGCGNIVLTQCVIHSNVVIGDFNTLLPTCHIAHDTKIGDSNFFAAQCCVGSGIRIGDMNFMGIGSAIRNGTTIGDCNLIGQYANVISDTENGVTLIGNPARPLIK